jgi:hypothetical protein
MSPSPLAYYQFFLFSLAMFLQSCKIAPVKRQMFERIRKT